jgi:hypothetical protein
MTHAKKSKYFRSRKLVSRHINPVVRKATGCFGNDICPILSFLNETTFIESTVLLGSGIRYASNSNHWNLWHISFLGYFCLLSHVFRWLAFNSAKNRNVAEELRIAYWDSCNALVGRLQNFISVFLRKHWRQSHPQSYFWHSRIIRLFDEILLMTYEYIMKLNQMEEHQELLWFHYKNTLTASFFSVVIRHCFVVSYRLSRQLIGSIFQETLEMGLIGRPETSVSDYQTIPRKNPEERGTHLHRAESLKSRNNSAYFNILPSSST